MSDKIKITLISPYDGAVSYGLRVISAYLKENGHNVDLIFSPSSRHFGQLYPESIIEDLCSLCQDSDLIGFSLMASYFPKVRDATIQLKKKLSIPIIWGGIHPTVKPRECLDYADMICIGEGEEAILELANKLKSEDIYKINNIWLRKDEEIIRNEARPLEENLDKYPFQDYDFSTHFISTSSRIERMTEDHLRRIMIEGRFNRSAIPTYTIITTRNCPYNCTYCCNNALRKIYRRKGKFVRTRSVENVIQELELVVGKFDFIEKISIKDDVFFVRTRQDVKKFSTLYREKVRLPMRCVFSPLDMDEEKFQYMVEAGTDDIGVGIQSYNEQTLLEIYRRPALHKAIIECVELIHKFKSKILYPQFHLIVDNPYEDIKAKQESITFAASLPPGTDITIFPLTIYPGTQMYDKAQQDGLIHDEIKEVYLKPWHTEVVRYQEYLSYVLYLCKLLKQNPSQRLPVEPIVKILIRNEFIYLFNRKVVLDLINYAMLLTGHARHYKSKIADVFKRPRYYASKYYTKLFRKNKRQSRGD